MYLSKQLLLSAFHQLSQLDGGNTQQGLTKKVSYVRHFMALDEFCKTKGVDKLDTTILQQKKDFVSCVAHVVGIEESKSYTQNFVDIKELADCGVGSNFFGGGPVLTSQQSTNLLDYPSKGLPLLKVKKQRVWMGSEAYVNIQQYLPNDKLRVALFLWVARSYDGFSLEDELCTELHDYCNELYSEKLIEAIFPSADAVAEFIGEIRVPVFSEQCAEFCNSDFSVAQVDNHTVCDKETNAPYLAAIRTKPFVLLAGISGTGKSRMVRQLARGCCPADSRLAFEDDAKSVSAKKPGNFEMIPVRPNWHDSSELMGYVTRLTADGQPKYVLTPFVTFLAKAWQNKDVPFFLCLDEMNLAPVEQYFAEYLSIIETRKLDGGKIATDVLVKFPDEVINGVLNDLAKEISSNAEVAQIPDEAVAVSEKRDKDALYRLWDDFLADWPITRLQGMTLDEYSKAGSPDTFTYALEAKLSRLGSIWGGSAFKFGIYSRDPNGKLVAYRQGSKQMGTNEYAWYRKFGLTKDAAWNTVKAKVVEIAEAAAKGDFSAVDRIDFPHVVKWKIAFLYQDRNNLKIVDIFKREWIVLLTRDMPRKTSFVDRYLKLNGERGQMDVFAWDDDVLSKRIMEELSQDEDEEGDEEATLELEGLLSQSPVLDMIRRDKGIRIPPNLVVMGTVNMDETTCSFSRKVLDRAMSFELNDVSDMYDPGKIANEDDVPFGSIPTASAMSRMLTGKEAYDTDNNIGDAVLSVLHLLNEEEVDAKKEDGSDDAGQKIPLLAKTPFKIAYRTRNEIMIYCLERCGGQGLSALPQALDEALSMKVLSRIEGDNQHVSRKWLVTLSSAIDTALGKLAGYDKDVCKVCREKLADMAEQANYGYTSFWTR